MDYDFGVCFGREKSILQQNNTRQTYRKSISLPMVLTMVVALATSVALALASVQLYVSFHVHGQGTVRQAILYADRSCIYTVSSWRLKSYVLLQNYLSQTGSAPFCHILCENEPVSYQGDVHNSSLNSV